jgi:hypothetical protein
MKYIFQGDELDGVGLMFAARVAYAGGLIEEMPTDNAEAVEAFESIGIEIECIE